MAHTPTVSERIKEMDDFRVVRFFQSWADDLCAGVTEPAAILAGVSEEISGTAEFAEISEMSPDQAEVPIHPEHAASVARAILEPLAESPELSRPLEEALDSFDDDKLVVDVILALGLVASVLMIISSSGYDKQGGFTFKPDPEMVKGIMDSVFARWRGAGAGADT